MLYEGIMWKICMNTMIMNKYTPQNSRMKENTTDNKVEQKYIIAVYVWGTVEIFFT